MSSYQNTAHSLCRALEYRHTVLLRYKPSPDTSHVFVLFNREGHSPRARAIQELVPEAYQQAGLIASQSDANTVAPLPAADAKDHKNSGSLTLVTLRNMTPLNSLTMHFDGQDGLSAEESYGREISCLRDKGARLVEMTKLGAHPHANDSAALFRLFHVAFLVLSALHPTPTHSVVEAHPRHGRIYARLLGFRQHGEETLCPRANNAAAVLLVGGIPNILARFNELSGDPNQNNIRRPALVPSEQVDVLMRLARLASRQHTGPSRIGNRPGPRKEKRTIYSLPVASSGN